MKHTLVAAALTLGMSGAAFAAPVVVSAGGVTWDSDTVTQEVSAGFRFSQWFTTSPTGPAKTITQSQFDSAVIIDPLPNPLPPVLELNAVGNFINFSNSRNSPQFFLGSANGTDCFSCELTFALGGVFATGLNTFDFSGGWIRVYLDTSEVADNQFNLIPAGGGDGVLGAADFLDAQDGILWAEFGFTDFALTDGDIAGGNLSAGLEVLQAIDLNTFNILNTFFTGADFVLNSSALFDLENPKFTDIDPSNGGVQRAVPEPGSIALIGLGLLAAGLSARRRSKA